MRGDAVELPFRDGSFDAVCCFAALHLFAEPFAALDHMARVLTPGGRVAIFTRARDALGAAAHRRRARRRRSGMRMFEHDEIAARWPSAASTDVRQRVSGLTQFVGGRKA